ncbi:hypothetical protein RI367_005065 [Sorochytrium milnesiophthora]
MPATQAAKKRKGIDGSPVKTQAAPETAADTNGLATEESRSRLLSDLNRSFADASERLANWFSTNLPRTYFDDIDAATQLDHLKAIIALEMTGGKEEISLVNRDKTIYTFIKSGNYPGLLAEVVHTLPKDRNLREAKIYTSLDDAYIIDVFIYDPVTLSASDDQTPTRKPLFTNQGREQTEKLQRVVKYAAECRSRLEHLPTDSEIEQFLKRCDVTYVMSSPSDILVHQIDMLYALSYGSLARIVTPYQPPTNSSANTTATPVPLSPSHHNQRCLIYVSRPVEYPNLFARIVTYLKQANVNVLRAKLTKIRMAAASLPRVKATAASAASAEEDEDVMILVLWVARANGDVIAEHGSLAQQLEQDLARVAWLDNEVLKLSDLEPSLTLLQCEVMLTCVQLLHCILSEQSPLVYTVANMLSFVRDNLQLAQDITQALCDKFATPDGQKPSSIEGRRVAFDKNEHALRQLIDTVDLDDAKHFFSQFLAVARGALKTNVHRADRLCLALRLDPTVFSGKISSMAPGKVQGLPFGVFFAFGRGFVGLHSRYRDIARGGIRIVIPNGKEGWVAASRGLIGEAFGLAGAQQLKNKDIPEGGSKGVVLLTPGHHARAAFKSFTDGLLDVILPQSCGVDYYGRQELLYLGPDENVTNHLINWVCQRAELRGHPYPSTFMSSKPGAGINHKEFGVTSEGVTVFLHIALNNLGIDPQRQPFTVKLTGGPDGDVGGNEIKILCREYGANARIVAIADGSGVGEDLDGLKHDELLRLVERGLPIASFGQGMLMDLWQKLHLGPRGKIYTVDDKQGVALRNNMHFRVASDVFIPAGGHVPCARLNVSVGRRRPYTVNDTNWKQFLDEHQQPKSRLIVEGANIFFTPHARHQLSQHGVMIIKDSSANKCGVVCSSFEILAGMLASESEFLSKKQAYVAEVLTRLRLLARNEAELLFREHKASGIDLPTLSVRISKAFIAVADAVRTYLSSLDAALLTAQPSPKKAAGNQEAVAAFLRRLVVDYVPQSLLGKADPQHIQQRVLGRLPPEYVKNVISCVVSGLVVYDEGTSFHLLRDLVHFDVAGATPTTLTDEAVAALGEKFVRYAIEREQIVQLIDNIRNGKTLDSTTRQKVIQVLRAGGARVMIDH